MDNREVTMKKLQIGEDEKKEFWGRYERERERERAKKKL